MSVLEELGNWENVGTSVHQNEEEYSSREHPRQLGVILVGMGLNTLVRDGLNKV